MGELRLKRGSQQQLHKKTWRCDRLQGKSPKENPTKKTGVLFIKNGARKVWEGNREGGKWGTSKGNTLGSLGLLNRPRGELGGKRTQLTRGKTLPAQTHSQRAESFGDNSPQGQKRNEGVRRLKKKTLANEKPQKAMLGVGKAL